MKWSDGDYRQLVQLKLVSKSSYRMIAEALGRPEAEIKATWQEKSKDPAFMKKYKDMASSNSNEDGSSPQRKSANRDPDDEEMSPAPVTPPIVMKRLRRARSLSPPACSPPHPRRELEPETPKPKSKRVASLTPEKSKRAKVVERTPSPKTKRLRKGSSATPQKVTPAEESEEEKVTVKRKSHRMAPAPYKDPAGLDPAEIGVEATVHRQVARMQDLIEGALKAGDLPKTFSIGTACSGTDAPILGMMLANEALAGLQKQDGRKAKSEQPIPYKHVMSCEIEPFKQAFLARNYKGATIFPDLTKLVPKDGSSKVQTCFGGEQAVPDCDIFIAGTVCKDFSMRKTKFRLDLEDHGKSGNTFFSAVDYVFKHRPMLAIFENVMNAPWEKMIEFITGRVLVESMFKGKVGGAKCVTSEKTGGEDVSDLLFKVVAKGKLEVIEVPRKAGVKLGAILTAIESETGTKRSAVVNGKVGMEIPFQKLRKMLTIKDSDTLIFDTATNGYLAYKIKVDSTSFELPQTRIRGYMLVWRKDVGGPEIGELWDELVRGLESPVQYSLQHFLLADDDERVRRVREVLRGPMGRRAREENAQEFQGDWWNSGSKDVQRSHVFRKDGHFDPEVRPITGWGKGGQRRAQPQFWQEFMGVINSRQCDLMDCFAMDCAAENPPRDVLHSSYVWDISQNVDIASSYNKPGVCGCITPGGWLLFPDRGRCMLGIEKLIVQGIPPSRLLVGSESEVQLSDLAGNAMSLPVILACTLSAISVKELARRRKKNPNYEFDFGKKAIAQRQQMPKLPMHIQEKRADRSPALPVLQALAKLCDTAEANSILCRCETSGSISQDEILHCTNCGWSICRGCAPQCALATHNLEVRPLGAARAVTPDHFQRQLREIAPQCLSFNDETLGKHELALVDVKRHEGRWTLRYLARDTVNAVAELRIHIGHLAIGTSEKGLRCELRTFEENKTNVAARLVMQAGQQKAQWEVQHPTEEAHMQLSGSQPGLSFRAEMTVGEYRKERWPEIIQVKNDQEYNRLPCRGTVAQGALWRSKDKSSFLYLRPDQDRTSKDVFHFATSASWKDAGVHTTAMLDADWEPSAALKKPELSVQALLPQWKAAPKLSLLKSHDGLTVDHDLPKKTNFKDGAETGPALITHSKDGMVTFELDGQMLRADETQFRLLTAASPQKKAKRTCASLQKAQSIQRSPCVLPICGVSGVQPAAVQRLVKSTDTNDWVDLLVTGPGSAQTVKQFSQAVGVALLRESFPSQFKEWTPETAVAPNGTTWGADPVCVPKPPVQRWEDRTRKYDPELSQAFERAMQERPAVWRPRMNASGNCEIRVCPEAAAHRAAAAVTHGDDQADSVVCCWRLVEPSKALEAEPAAFKVPNSDTYEEAATPEMFVKKYALYPRQARALARMQSVESGSVVFSQEERSEHALPGVGWLFEAKAEVKCHLPGGVLADEMGAGKTVTTIALIANGRDAAKECQRSDKDPMSSRASLVMAPPNLIMQWDDERKKFTGDKLKTILLPDAAALSHVTAQELLDADMVIASFELLEEASYKKNLGKKANYEGLPDLPSGSGHREPERMTGIWVPGHPAAVYGTSKGKQQDREKMAYFSEQYSKTIEELRKTQLSPDSKFPPLESFKWHRVVVDEVHCAFCMTNDEKENKGHRAAREMLGVAQPNKDLRPLRAVRGIWGLTGTPMLSNETRVTEMASLMGGMYIMGAMQHWRGLERASVRDQFLLAQEPLPSTHYRAQARQHAQDYILKSVQRNRIEKYNLTKCIQKQEKARFTPTAAKKYLDCFVEDKKNFAPALEVVPEMVLQRVLDELACADERGCALQQVIRRIHEEKGDHTKIAVFTPAGSAANAARKVLSENGVPFFDGDDKNFGAFAREDLTAADRATPRILLLTFEQAAGLNLQHSCHHAVLFAPLFRGLDAHLACAQEQQAIGRLHRPGQKQDVRVYRIIVTGPQGQETMDSRLLARNTNESTIKAVTSD